MKEEFIQSGRFETPIPGYYFGTGEMGLGYYKMNGNGDGIIKQEEMVDEKEGRKKRRVDGGALLREMEEQARGGAREMDGKGLKRLIQNLEKKYNVNVEQRAKYAAEPNKFLESEVDLDEAVRAFQMVTASGELYPELASSEAVPIFLSLLQHENGDIAADAIELLSELTEADALESYEEEAGMLIDALLANGLIDVLVQRLTKLDESIKEEAAAVYNSLSVLENCVDVKPEIAPKIAEAPGVMEWLCNRLSPKAEVDSNKQYSSEVLAVVLQSGGSAGRARFVELGGVDRALLSIAPYRQKTMHTPEEEEFVENVFDVLCTLLIEDAAKQAFVESEGVELMIIILKSRSHIRTAALKCLDFATTKFSPCCVRAIQKGLLPLLFGVFMGKVKVKKGESGRRMKRSEKQEEELRCISIISNLFAGIEDREDKVRLLAKFVENEFEKCDRVMEILDRCGTEVAEEENRIHILFQGSNVDEEELLIARMDAGLFTLQQCCLIIAELWGSGDRGLRSRILMLLHQKGYTLGYIRDLLSEYKSSLGSETKDSGVKSENDASSNNKEAQRVDLLLHSMIQTPKPEPTED